MTKQARRALAAAGIAALMAAALAQPGSASSRREAHGLAPRADSPVAGAVLTLLNQQRTRRGLKPLHRNPRLDAAADWQSRDMVTHRYFRHQRRGGPGLVQRIRRTGYLRGATSWTVGENIAWAEAQLATPAQFVAGWMSSPEHRANVLDRSFRAIGIGVTTGAPAGNGVLPALTITTDFGVRSG
jgi:uncharacterized protein YkwD